MSHELRTPLSIILGYNSMLAESLNDRLSEEEKELGVLLIDMGGGTTSVAVYFDTELVSDTWRKADVEVTQQFWRRPLAAALGADATIDARSPDVTGQVREALGGSADIVFDCVSVQSSLDQAIGIADKGGTVMVVGVPAREVTVPLPIVQDHQIRIQGSATYLPPDYAESADLLRRGAVRTADFVTAVRPLAQVAEAFELASSGQHVKVLVSVDSPERLTGVHV